MKKLLLSLLFILLLSTVCFAKNTSSYCQFVKDFFTKGNYIVIDYKYGNFLISNKELIESIKIEETKLIIRYSSSISKDIEYKEYDISLDENYNLVIKMLADY